MNRTLISNILFWTSFSQKKYKKKYKKLSNRRQYFINMQKTDKKIEKKDYRIYLGSLKYTPLSVASLLKNLPMPWGINENLGILVHESKSLLLIHKNNKIIPEFMSSLWNLIWLLNKKEKIKRLFFNRINFPIFDDNENFHNYENFKKKKINSLTLDNYLEDNFNTTFCSLEILCQHYRHVKKKSLIYKDNILKIGILKIEFQSGLYEIRNRIAIKKNSSFATNSPFFVPQKILSNERTYPQSIKDDLINETGQLVSYFYRKNDNLLNKGLKDRTRRCYFEFDSKFPAKRIFFSSWHQKKFNFSENRKNSKKKCVILRFTNKKYIFLFDFIKPFFFDIFFSQQRLSFFLKFHFDLSDISGSFYSLIPTWNTSAFEKVLVNMKKFFTNNLSLSYLSLLKYFSYIGSPKKKNKVKYNISNTFKKNIHFDSIKSTWIQVGTEICLRSYELLSLLIKRKGLSYLNLDFNFNLKPIKTLTTKERKKSRFSNTFHFFREFLRFMKLLVDCHIKFYSGLIDFFELLDGVHFILTHIGKITGIYRYKYKIMKQIKICKAIKKIFYEKFYTFSVPTGPGFGCWPPVWKVWVYYLRGMVPVQERWISNLLSRHFHGRRYSRKTFSATKQRKDAYLDIELKLALVREIKNNMENSSKKDSLKLYIKYSNEAWKSWKSNKNWFPTDLPRKIENVILDYIKTKSIWWTRGAYLIRESLIKGIPVSKPEIKKNLGRITRLWFKSENTRQLEYLKKGPYFSKNDSFFIENIFNCWITINQIQKIKFPSFKNKWDLKLLVLTLDYLKRTDSSNKKERAANSIEQNLLKNAMSSPINTLLGIKDSLLIQRIFSEIGMNFVDNFSYLNPVYIINFAERIVDGYLDQYLWYQCSENFLFPSWITPNDSQINPYSYFKFEKKIKNYLKSKNFRGKNVKIGKIEYGESIDNLDLILMDKILIKILDPNLVSYVTLKNNVNLIFKDMTSLNSIGIIRGLQFGVLITQLYYLIFDLLILGIKNALSLVRKNSDLYSNVDVDLFKYYSRYISKIIFVIEVDKSFKCEKFLNKIEKKIPSSLGFLTLRIIFDDQTTISSSRKNYSFEFCGFSLFISEKINFFSKKKEMIDNIHSFKDKDNFKSKISSIALLQFENRIRQIIINSGSTTFTKLVNKWNSSILGLITYFREIIKKNKNSFMTLSNSEQKIQTRIKASLNSKMPSRFPLVLFFAPKELGGLGMISVSTHIIPDNDLKYKKNNQDIQQLNENEKPFNKWVPMAINFIKTWRIEFQESKWVWNEFMKRRNKFKIEKKTILFENIEDLWDKGIPRINTLFQKEREILAFDHGWRLRKNFEKFQVQKNDPFWWIDRRHDGKLWDLNFYKTEMIKDLGGIENILEHSLFKGTYFPTWEGLFWEKSSGFEEILENKKLTTAQRSGLNQIPNRRFTLWWSPTINRANIYIGFQVQLDLTGIFMHGKIPTLKISLIQLFRSHLWQKIHQSLVLNLCRYFEQNSAELKISSVQKEQIHPRKSYKMNSSCADIILVCNENWKISNPSLLTSNKTNFKVKGDLVNNFWIDIQLRWGDFDSHDIERYARGKFMDFTVYKNAFYPFKYGIIIAIDLCYNLFSGFGYSFSNLKHHLLTGLKKLMKNNSALYILRDRIRKGLQLYSGKCLDSIINKEDYFEMFKSGISWLIDDSLFYRVSVQQSQAGNIKTKPINGVMHIFLPKNGNLLLRIIDSKIWKQQKRLTQLARWKAAEEILTFLQTVSPAEKPDQIIVVRKNLIDPLEIQLIETPTILIKHSVFKITFKSLLKFKKINEKVQASRGSETIFFNLYDNWLNSVSPFTAFSRLILILKGLEFDFEKINKLLGFNSREKRAQHFWPLFSDDQWIEIEIVLKDLILKDFADKNNIDPTNLFQSEIRDIIFGNQNNILNISSRGAGFEEKTLNTVHTFTNSGKKLKTMVSSTNLAYQSNSTLKGDFFHKNIKSTKFLRDIVIPKTFKVSCSYHYIFPVNLLKKLICDTYDSILTVSIIFGKPLILNVNIIEIRVIVLIPEIKEILPFLAFKNSKKLNIINSLDFLGYLIKENQFSLSRKPLYFHEQIPFQGKNFQNQMLFLYILIQKKKIFLKGLRITPDIKQNKSISIFLSRKYFGIMLDLFDLNCLI